MTNETWRGHTCIYGTTGYGKSTLADYLVKGRAKIIRLDPQAKPGTAIPTTPEGINKARDIALAKFNTGFDILLTPAGDGGVVGLNRLVPLLQRIQAGYLHERDPRPLVLLLDEASKIIPSERQKTDLRGAQEVHERGRHWGIELIAVTQRPARLDADIKANMEAVYTFRMGVDDDRAVVTKLIGRQHASLLANLPKFNFIKWTVDGVMRGSTTARGGITKLTPL